MIMLAIHHRPGSFSDQWIAYCENNDVSYKVVNAFDSDIVDQIKGCSAFMWHHHHGAVKDILAAKRILFSLEHAGIKTFPDFKSGWHFDDKVAQKYLLEAVGAPLVPSYIFYDEDDAISWANSTKFPKVFKLKGGAGAVNVRLVKNLGEAKKLIKRAFGKGFPQYDSWMVFKDRFREYQNNTGSIVSLLKGVAGMLSLPEYARQLPNEKGYVYFQDYIPGNSHDIRVVVIGGEYAVAERRFVRRGDFRASGSGHFDYDQIPENAVKLAFSVAKELDLQSVAFDFIVSPEGKMLIVEMCYGFGVKGISKAPGYWDQEMRWYEGKFSPQECILKHMISGAGLQLRTETA